MVNTKFRHIWTFSGQFHSGSETLSIGVLFSLVLVEDRWRWSLLKSRWCLFSCLNLDRCQFQFCSRHFPVDLSKRTRLRSLWKRPDGLGARRGGSPRDVKGQRAFQLTIRPQDETVTLTRNNLGDEPIVPNMPCSVRARHDASFSGRSHSQPMTSRIPDGGIQRFQWKGHLWPVLKESST